MDQISKGGKNEQCSTVSNSTMWYLGVIYCLYNEMECVIIDPKYYNIIIFSTSVHPNPHIF